jgi:hypothetical protein
MAILNIKLDLDDSYVRLIKDVYKWLIIIIFIHLLLCISYGEKGSMNLVGEFLHSDFITLIIYIILGFAFYYLVMEKIIIFD